MATRLPASQHTREELTALIEGGLSTASAKDELVKLATRLNVEEAERVLQMMESNYRFGAATTVDVVDAQAALSSSGCTPGENGSTSNAPLCSVSDMAS